MKYIIFLLLCLTISCQSSKDADNKYFYNLNNELLSVMHQLDKTKALQKRELKKYEQTGDRKFLISSKYAEMFLYILPENRIKQIPLVYELIRLNDSQYDFISVACKFNLASQFETTSPELSMQFLNEAISLDKKVDTKFFLPHLYHVKGRWYYKKENYSEALFYFNKALKKYSPSDLLFIASMHNNFGMCYDKMNKMDRAIEEANTAVNILEHKANPTDEEKFFICYFKGYLAEYLLKVKDYKNAEKLFIRELDFCKNKKPHYPEAIKASHGLFKLYSDTHENNKLKDLVIFLKSIESNLKNVSEKIDANQIIENYYLNINDLTNFKIISKKLEDLNIQRDKESNAYLSMISDQLNNSTIKSINQKYDYQIADQSKKIWILLLLIVFSLLTFGVTLISVRNRNKKEKELTEKQKLIFEANKKVLEQEIKIKKNKIENLHLNLNLKVEAEKVFLENLKKIKKNKNVNTEEMLQDLFFKINNLIQINSNSNDLTNESSLENIMFIEKLSHQFPFLTAQEKKLCSYFKLGLSSKEISLLENITDGSARVYKARIKSKMKLDKDTDLDSFLNNL